MNPRLIPFELVMAGPPAARTAPHPQPALLLAGLLLGVIAGIVAGQLHRKDGSSVPAAVGRGGAAFIGGTTLSLSALLSTAPLSTVTLLLGSAVVAIAAGVLCRMDGGSVPTAIWKAARAFAAVAALGQAILLLYSSGAAGVAMTALWPAVPPPLPA
jgi:hypothetical protein